MQSITEWSLWLSRFAFQESHVSISTRRFTVWTEEFSRLFLNPYRQILKKAARFLLQYFQFVIYNNLVNGCFMT